ncbi:hypothetical protein NQ317_007102 [Molorchus minor]|uniref:Kinase n=1 Tax=Molorchus minor TaxID=1323400 RepID=A0ABQ9K634_9CUCU|nr:hypothetical protein NQ317_007102 [Molorchus minor]
MCGQHICFFGVRLCGMQVYVPETDCYYKKDKYWGRQLDEEGLRNALCRFFDNGHGLKVSVIRRVIAKLEELRSVIEKQSCYSSLLIVYEGGNTVPHLIIPKQTCCANAPSFYCDNDCTRASEDSSRDVPGYEADTSNSSIDFRLSGDEVSQDSHHRGYGEAAAKGTKSNTFFPISEETVFLDSPPPPSTATSSPISMNSWMVYSNSSSDEYSLPVTLNSSSSNEDTSDFESSSPSKRNCPVHFDDLELEDEHEQLLPVIQNIPKRLFAGVEVRIIDFAHTSFVRTNEGNSKTVHEGPDGGFLTGLDSLKRLLSQVIGNQNWE